jgi:hypothetical protein
MIIFPKKTHPEAPVEFPTFALEKSLGLGRGSATVAGRTCKTHLSGALVARFFREDFRWVIWDIILNIILIYCVYIYTYGIDTWYSYTFYYITYVYVYIYGCVWIGHVNSVQNPVEIHDISWGLYYQYIWGLNNPIEESLLTKQHMCGHWVYLQL